MENKFNGIKAAYINTQKKNNDDKSNEELNTKLKKNIKHV